MNLIDRAKNILSTPKTEWIVIDTEATTPENILAIYVMPLAAIFALGTLLSAFPPPYSGSNALWLAINEFIAILIGFYISTYIIDLLAPGFNSERKRRKSAQLLAYSYTPVLLAGFMSFIFVLGDLFSIGGFVYSVYLFYNGLGIMKKTPENKKVVYMIVAFIVVIVIYFIVGAILNFVMESIVSLGTMG